MPQFSSLSDRRDRQHRLIATRSRAMTRRAFRLQSRLSMTTSFHHEDSLRTPRDAPAVYALLKPDRRIHRTPDPPCDRCENAMPVIWRTTDAVAFRCTECFRVRLIPLQGLRVRCPECGSEHVRRSRTTLWERPRRWLTGHLPVYCCACNWSGWSSPHQR